MDDKTLELKIEPGSFLDELGKRVARSHGYHEDNVRQSAFWRKQRYERSAKGKATRAAYQAKKRGRKE